ncbi:proteasome accessory factor PafA2 family protein [Pseudobacteriovorax antillogorgiicola]|uniref:Proteasome accessory factor A n=1 Tax=Pseudobacteriovorax antillogorgiicola TaxID=1513793 RepID=A0A1Y6CFC8_9BACT|nr:proteasome accessory factor PafA2 family protein [Pseudobacteriovorax antillogorgiicola]TCS47251.1 proteasome accessory factor A [Pseudobacteriovorax antillogorgiicola]SMF62044.1 proteasome accessory factor A [Pseudobacteriovorax antillogorgiicola]
MASDQSHHLLGQETELAIRFQERNGDHPGNKVIFDYMARAIKSIVKTKPGKRNFIQDQFFVQNGGAVYYEHHPQSLRRGLIESATPECHSAHELILYQRAQEALLIKALPMAQKMMSYDGYEGELSLLKNCRDYEGNTYGSQENYDSFVAEGWRWYMLIACLLAYVPFALVLKLVYLTLLVPFVMIIFTSKVFIELLLAISSLGPLEKVLNRIKAGSSWRTFLQSGILRFDFEAEDTEETLLKVEYSLFYPLFWISYKPLIMLYNQFAFGPQRQAIHSHVISRIIFTGAGSLIENDRFILSEKSLAINCFLRRSIHRNDKPLFDCGNLIKEYELALWELFLLRVHSWATLFKREQRLQIAFSDSNRCHFSEFLKVGSTSLVVRLANDGFLNDAPEFLEPIKALGEVSRDIDLKQTYPMKDGSTMNAIEIQQWYCQRAKEYLQTGPVNIEDHEVVRLWEQTLATLQRDPAALLGRVDWITKQYLLSTSGEELDYWGRKKIDLKYHELGDGYFEILQSRGLTLDLFSDEDVERAIYEPSSSRRAKVRSRLIKSIALENHPMTISWSQAKIGRWNPKVISLSDYRKTKEIEEA